jgi:hypothetical protein
MTKTAQDENADIGSRIGHQYASAAAAAAAVYMLALLLTEPVLQAGCSAGLTDTR